MVYFSTLFPSANSIPAKITMPLGWISPFPFHVARKPKCLIINSKWEQCLFLYTILKPSVCYSSFYCSTFLYLHCWSQLVVVSPLRIRCCYLVHFGANGKVASYWGTGIAYQHRKALACKRFLNLNWNAQINVINLVLLMPFSANCNSIGICRGASSRTRAAQIGVPFCQNAKPNVVPPCPNII